ncbi:TPA: hypothetical protein ACY2HE_003559 [Yersinia enterocolitica]
MVDLEVMAEMALVVGVAEMEATQDQVKTLMAEPVGMGAIRVDQALPVGMVVPVAMEVGEITLREGKGGMAVMRVTAATFNKGRGKYENS